MAVTRGDFGLCIVTYHELGIRGVAYPVLDGTGELGKRVATVIVVEVGRGGQVN